MYPVWLHEESLVTISIEFTVVLYVRIRVSVPRIPKFARLFRAHSGRHSVPVRRRSTATAVLQITKYKASNVVRVGLGGLAQLVGGL